MDTQNNVNVNPTYKELLVGVGHQLANRKKDLFKRILLMAWPLVLFTGTLSILYRTEYINELISTDPVMVAIVFAVFVILVVPYYFIIGIIVKIEQHLWIDSAFDNKSIDSKKSWSIAWKLIIPSFQLAIRIFTRYYLMPLMIALFSMIVIGFVVLNSGLIKQASDNYTLIYVFMFVLISLSVYIYYLKIKLRFIYFLFIDTFNDSNFNYSNLFGELRELNKISGSEGFTKALVADFGTATAAGIGNLATDSIQSGMSSMSNAAGFAGDLLRPLAKETIRQVKIFSKLSAIYLMYKKARLQKYGTEQEINEYIYNL